MKVGFRLVSGVPLEPFEESHSIAKSMSLSVRRSPLARLPYKYTLLNHRVSFGALDDFLRGGCQA